MRICDKDFRSPYIIMAWEGRVGTIGAEREQEASFDRTEREEMCTLLDGFDEIAVRTA